MNLKLLTEEPKLPPIRPRRSTPSVKRRGRVEERPRTCCCRVGGRDKNDDGWERGQGAGVAGGGALGEQLDGVEHVGGEPHGSRSLTAPLEVGA